MITEQANSFRYRWTISALFAGTALWAASGCDRGPATSVEQQAVPKVTTTDVIQRETIDYDEYTGRTEASEAVEIRARVFGYLKTIDFQDGDFVKEGQKLFTIEPDEYQAIHDQSLSKIAVWESKLEVAKASLARRKQTVAKGAITREEYEEYVAAVREAEAALVAAKADANRTAVDLEIHRRQSSDQRPHRSGLCEQRNAAHRRGLVGHASDEDRQRAADVRVL